MDSGCTLAVALGQDCQSMSKWFYGFSRNSSLILIVFRETYFERYLKQIFECKPFTNLSTFLFWYWWDGWLRMTHLMASGVPPRCLRQMVSHWAAPCGHWAVPWFWHIDWPLATKHQTTWDFSIWGQSCEFLSKSPWEYRRQAIGHKISVACWTPRLPLTPRWAFAGGNFFRTKWWKLGICRRHQRCDFHKSCQTVGQLPSQLFGMLSRHFWLVKISDVLKHSPLKPHKRGDFCGFLNPSSLNSSLLKKSWKSPHKTILSSDIYQ